MRIFFIPKKSLDFTEILKSLSKLKGEIYIESHVDKTTNENEVVFIRIYFIRKQNLVKNKETKQDISGKVAKETEIVEIAVDLVRVSVFVFYLHTNIVDEHEKKVK